MEEVIIPKKITIRSVLHRALRNMISSRKGDWWHAIQVMTFLCALAFGGFILYFNSHKKQDFYAKYPTAEELQVASGMLVEAYSKKINYFLLEVSDSPIESVIRDRRLITDRQVIPIINDYTLWDPLAKQKWNDGAWITPHFVTIKYFRLPGSRMYWLAQLDYEGKTLINYEKRKADFSQRRHDQKEVATTAMWSILIGILAFLGVVIEAYKQLKRESEYGKE